MRGPSSPGSIIKQLFHFVLNDIAICLNRPKWVCGNFIHISFAPLLYSSLSKSELRFQIIVINIARQNKPSVYNRRGVLLYRHSFFSMLKGVSSYMNLLMVIFGPVGIFAAIGTVQAVKEACLSILFNFGAFVVFGGFTVATIITQGYPPTS